MRTRAWPPLCVLFNKMKYMKKYLFIILGALLGLVSCEQPSPSSVGQFSIVPPVLQMKVGDVQLLELSIVTTGEVVWTSSDEEVVKVSAGVVTAEAIGFATVTAAIGDSKAICSVYVSGSSGQTLTLNKYMVSLNKGETFQFQCKNTYGTPVEWRCDHPEIATIDQQGLLTAIKPGLATVTVTSEMESVTAKVAVNHQWGEYQLVWSDEFNGTELDRNVWNVEVNGNGGGNQESQYYLDRAENLRVENGNLIIQLRNDGYGGKPYTSGRINSKNKKSFTYGKIEANISFPAGKGTWPAFWMLGYGNWPACGEIDIIEHIGSRPSFSSFAVHTSQRNGMTGNNWHAGYTADESMENAYHVYGIEWTQEEENGCDKIHFFVDNKEYAVVSEDFNYINTKSYWPFNDKHFIIFNLAIGGTMGGSIDDALFNQGDVLMKVDWVRVWQREEKE